MRNYGISRYMSYSRYHPTSLYSRNRTSVYQQFSTKSNSANAARKAYQSNTYSGTTASRLNEAVSGVATSVSALSKAMQTDTKTGALDREKAYSAAKDFVDSYNELYSSVKSSRSGFVSGRTTVMANTARAYSGTLEDAGVTVAKDGSLTLDKEKFMSADDKSIDRAFGRSSNFTGAAVSQAVSVSKYASTEAVTSYGGYGGFGGYSKNDLFGYAGTSRSGVLAGYLLNQWI